MASVRSGPGKVLGMRASDVAAVLALAALVASCILMAVGQDARALVSAVLFVGLVVSPSRVP